MLLPEKVPLALPSPCRRARIARAATALLTICAIALALGGAWFARGRAREEEDQSATNYNGRTRVRRVRLETHNQSRRIAASANAISNLNVKTNNAQPEMSGTNLNNHNSRNAAAPFYVALNKHLKKRGKKLSEVCSQSNAVERRVLEDYGAMFIAAGVLPPPICMFTNQLDVSKFQTEAGFTAATVGGAKIELQPAAMEALLEAREEARAEDLNITPRGGTEAARRDYDDTLRLWNTRFLPALDYWSSHGRLSTNDVIRLRALPIERQVEEVLELEKSGIFFSKDLSKSILYSIAAPGTSQHIAMLALDVTQFQDARVRCILAHHGWFQTVKSDLPHFTYLGLKEEDLPAHGLRKVIFDAQEFWIPDVESE